MTSAGPATIAAVATAPGCGGVGIVRVSGPAAAAVGEAVFRRRGGRPLAAAPPATLVLGSVVDPATGEALDEALAARMPAGRSYTGEETVELHCHGGPAVLEAVLGAVLSAGARRAGPGEFTRRALAAGRLDLPQAEAVAELVASRTDSQRRAALARLAGATGSAVRDIRGRVLEIAAGVEALLEFGEEDGVGEPLAGAALAAAAEEVRGLVADGECLRRESRGARVVVAGRANCGKSSLFNMLCCCERSIVTSLPGTTRDYVEQVVTLGGAEVVLVDTAGFRAPEDEAEAIGIARTAEALDAADFVLHLVDGSLPAAAEDFALSARIAGIPRLLVVTKGDLPRAVSPADLSALGGDSLPLETSAVTGKGCASLAARLAEIAPVLEAVGTAPGPAAPNARQTEALARALAHLDEASALAAGTELDLLAEELKAACRALDEVTGEGAPGELLDRVFSRFCVGK